MKVIARIPSLVPETPDRRSPSAARTGEPIAAAVVQADAPRRGVRPAFPGVSVAVLAVLAAVVWTLASWNDGRRLEQARQERIARMQSFQPAPGTVAR